MIVARLFIISILLAFSSRVEAQSRTPVWYIPSEAKEINGLAIGPINSMVLANSLARQTINGVQFELGMGVFMLIGPADPWLGSKVYEGRQHFVDSAIANNSPYWLRGVNVNGLAISPLGSVGLHTVNGVAASLGGLMAIRMNGLAVNPVWNSAGSMNGVALAIFFNSGIYANGLQATVFANTTIESRGVQLGAINRSDLLYGLQTGIYNSVNSLQGLQIGLLNIADEVQGLQIGLLNISSDRWLPLVNW